MVLRKIILKIFRKNSNRTTKPEVFPKSNIKSGLYKCVITRQTTMYYTFNEKSIYVLTIFDSRQDPEKLKDEVK